MAMNYPLLITSLIIQSFLVITSPRVAHSQSHCIDYENERIGCTIIPITGAIFAVTYPDRKSQNYYAEIINEAPDGSCYVTFIDNETYEGFHYQTDQMKCSRKGSQYITDIDGVRFIYVFR